MKILLNNQMLYEAIGSLNNVGFVPTMGGIHKGHISLINKSKKNCKKTLVSIFINPKQFNNIEDLKSYPSNIKKDLSILRKNKKVDFVYMPKFEDIYRSNNKSKIKIDKIDINFIKDKNKQSRIIVGEIKHQSVVITLVNIYVPNGNPIDTEKYEYKKYWYSSFIA